MFNAEKGIHSCFPKQKRKEPKGQRWNRFGPNFPKINKQSTTGKKYALWVVAMYKMFKNRDIPFGLIFSEVIGHMDKEAYIKLLTLNNG